MKNFSEFGVKILFLLIPGIVAVSLTKSLGPKIPRSDLELGLSIFVYGIASYATAGVVTAIVHSLRVEDLSPALLSQMIRDRIFILVTVNSNTDLTKVPVISATALSVVIGVLIAKLQTNSLPHRIMRLAGLTNRTAEVDIWGFTMNTPDLDRWVTVRHHDNGKVYQGWIRGYSDGGDERELLLVDVAVYSPSKDDQEELIQVDTVPVLYLGLDRQNATLEFQAKMTKIDKSDHSQAWPYVFGEKND